MVTVVVRVSLLIGMTVRLATSIAETVIAVIIATSVESVAVSVLIVVTVASSVMGIAIFVVTVVTGGIAHIVGVNLEVAAKAVLDGIAEIAEGVEPRPVRLVGSERLKPEVDVIFQVLVALLK